MDAGDGGIETTQMVLGDGGKAVVALGDATVYYKFQCIIIIFASAIIGGLIPLRRTSSPQFLSYGNCFSGGIFLSAGFIHMLSESMEGFEKLEWATPFPVVMFFTILGILLPFFIERVVLEQHDHGDIFTSSAQRTVDSTGSATDPAQVNIYVLWLMLGVHSIIEGMALGVEKDSKDVTAILIAILSHKFFSAFALGISLVKAGIPSRRTIQLVASFSLSVPSGIVLGIILSSAITEGFFNSLLTEIMKAIAAGTFIYVALVEIILEEFDTGHKHAHGEHDAEAHQNDKGHSHENINKYHKFIFVLIGVVLSCVFAVYHSHEGE